MTIETTIRHNGLLFRDRIFISDAELLHLPKKSRPEIIATAKRICAVRCIQKWRHHVMQSP